MGDVTKPSEVAAKYNPQADGHAASYDDILQRVQAKRKRVATIAWVSLLAPGSLGVALFIYAFKLSRTIDLNKALIAKQVSKLDSLNTRIKAVTPAALQAYGWSADSVRAADSSRIGVSLQANDMIHGLQGTTAIPEGLRVLYFAKQVDRNRENLLASLQQLGFSVTVRRPSNDDETNAIWVGDNVPVDVARMLGLALVRAGYRVKLIARFRNSTDKELLVQIGRNPFVLTRPDLSPDSIKVMTSLERDTTQ